MQGCGNDYVFVDGMTEQVPRCERVALARCVSDRHFGVGADGLIFLQRGKRAPFEMEMYNADGSRGEMCGNGMRCLAKLLWDRKYVHENSFQIESGGRVRKVEILQSASTDGGELPEKRACQVRVWMGEPVPGSEIRVYGRKLFKVSMGNPHAVAFLEEKDAWPVLEEGPLLEKAPCFPDRTNVEFVKVLDCRTIQMRVWERGSGETLACGSGACAAAAACIQKGLTDKEITVKLSGGELQAVWKQEGMILTGPAVTVFRGDFPWESPGMSVRSGEYPNVSGREPWQEKPDRQQKADGFTEI